MIRPVRRNLPERSMPKVGRNDPCPCSSGRKHKQCCLAAASGPTDLLWHRLRHAIDPLVADLLRFSRDEHGDALIEEAWDEFTLGDEPEPFSPETVHMPVFIPWFLYDWSPDPADTAVPAHLLDGFPVAAAFLRRARRVPPLLAQYVQACLERPFSFLEVVASTPGTGFRLRDVLTGAEHEVTERSASQGSRAGDILFGKPVTVDHLTLLDGCGPALIPPVEKAAIIALRRELRKGRRTVTDAVVREFDIEVRDVYLDITDRLLTPRAPRLQNTDGEALSLQRITWEVPSARAAFDALAAVAQGIDGADLPDDATLSTAGELETAEFPWLREGNAKHRSWTNTVLGHFRVHGRQLTVEVNSAERARLARLLVDDAMSSAVHRGTVVESPEAALAAHRAVPPAERAARERETEELRRDPELQAHMTEFLRQHYRDWIDASLPALGGMTPRQAMRTRDGREMVEALLVGLERQEGGDALVLDPSIIAEVRATLQAAIPARTRAR
jgi:SEC-C motif/Protein of unknown function (DUF2384)